MPERNKSIARLAITTAIALPAIVVSVELYTNGSVSGLFLAAIATLAGAYLFAASRVTSAMEKIWDQSALVLTLVLVSAFFLGGPDVAEKQTVELDEPLVTVGAGRTGAL